MTGKEVAVRRWVRKKKEGFLDRAFRGFLFALPVALIFSYFPVIRLGGNETMNFELSLTLFWLLGFDTVVFFLVIRERTFKGIFKDYKWLLFPLFLTVSVLWSLNFIRGVLTVGVLWLLYFAGYGMFTFRGLLGEGFREKFWKVFFGSFLGICLICLLQCILDLAGVSREVTQMCPGCTYGMFGFPHPNGFSIEPQFMGNLLLAPAIVSGVSLVFEEFKVVRRRRNLVLLFLVFAASIFLTFSRGAIYAFIVAMVVMVVVEGVRRKVWRRGALVLGLMVGAFLVTLNFQGVMAAVSKTDDTYISGVSKVLNQLSLGVIKIESGGGDGSRDNACEKLDNEFLEHDSELEKLNIEKCDENTLLNENGEKDDFSNGNHDSGSGKRDTETAVFNGYVAESTDTRMRLTGAAIQVWSSGGFGRSLFGVGLGGAGQALYNNELSPAPKEIVQNQYASLLLETGIVGVALFGFSLWLVFRAVWKSSARVLLLTLIFAYGITLFFFSGLPNALQIYLAPMIFYSITLRKKFVS